MTSRFEPPRESTPEEAAVTGGVPAAAEPAPQTRDRRSSHAAFAWLAVVVGALLLLVGALAEQDTEAQIGTLIAGAALIAAAILRMTDVIGTVLFAFVALLGGAVLALAAFSGSDLGVTQAVILGAAAFTFLGGFGSLASSRAAASSAADEPDPGVENV